MTGHSTITVKEWFFDKICEAVGKYHWFPVATYKDGMRDDTKLRVEEVLAETEKAYKVTIDCETSNNSVKTYTTWIPKSVIC